LLSRHRPRRRATLNALSPDRYRLQLTISGDTLRRLQQAKDLLRHAVPAGDDAAILDRALAALIAALIAELARKKRASTKRPRPARGVAVGSRHVPAEVRRAVYTRDDGRCAFVGATGRRCDERAFVELHHVQSYADDGQATIDNIELRCRRHNAYEWQQRCGDQHDLDVTLSRAGTG
jgi:hypothetical protein